VDRDVFRLGAGFATTRSRHFRIDVCAKLNDFPLFKRYFAVVEVNKEDKKIKILYFKDISHLRVNPW
jgi:hypothetical protein